MDSFSRRFSKSNRPVRWLLCIIFFLFSISSCQTRTGTGVIAGGALGAVVGGATGGGSGALIGGAAGIIAGGLVGAALDEHERRKMNEKSPKTVEKMDQGTPLTVTDIIQLHQAGIDDETIIHYIESSGTTYSLTQSQIRRMQKAGVSQTVINFMIETGM